MSVHTSRARRVPAPRRGEVREREEELRRSGTDARLQQGPAPRPGDRRRRERHGRLRRDLRRVSSGRGPEGYFAGIDLLNDRSIDLLKSAINSHLNTFPISIAILGSFRVWGFSRAGSLGDKRCD